MIEFQCMLNHTYVGYTDIDVCVGSELRKSGLIEIPRRLIRSSSRVGFVHQSTCSYNIYYRYTVLRLIQFRFTRIPTFHLSGVEKKQNSIGLFAIQLRYFKNRIFKLSAQIFKSSVYDQNISVH